MNSYFKPWRRMFGVLTLILVCICMIYRERSFGRRPYRGDDVYSSNGAIMYSIAYYRAAPFEIATVDADGNKTISIENIGPPMTWQELKAHWAASGREWGNHYPDRVDVIWRLPYSYIIIPLIVMSAWLLLSKPRAKKVEPPITPASENA